MAAAQSNGSPDRCNRADPVWHSRWAFTRNVAALFGRLAVGSCDDSSRQYVRRQPPSGRLRDWSGNLGLPPVCDDFWSGPAGTKAGEAKLLETALGADGLRPQTLSLIERAGGISRFLLNDHRELSRLTGSPVLAAQLVAIKDIAVAFLKSDEAPPFLSDNHTLLRYLRAVMGPLRIETCRVIFLDAHNRVLSDEVMSSGTIGEVHIHAREIMRRALEIDATSFIIAHNHPSGILQPSDADIALTQELITASSSMGLCMHDHLIVTARGVLSIRHERWIEPWR